MSIDQFQSSATSPCGSNRIPILVHRINALRRDAKCIECLNSKDKEGLALFIKL